MVGINTNLYLKTPSNQIVVEAVDQWLEFLRIPKINVHCINATINHANPTQKVQELSAKMLKRFIKINKFDRVIAVGDFAQKAMELTGIASYGSLPHPVVDSAIMTNKKKMIKSLEACKRYIYGEF